MLGRNLRRGVERGEPGRVPDGDTRRVRRRRGLRGSSINHSRHGSGKSRSSASARDEGFVSYLYCTPARTKGVSPQGVITFGKYAGTIGRAVDFLQQVAILGTVGLSGSPASPPRDCQGVERAPDFSRFLPRPSRNMDQPPWRSSRKRALTHCVPTVTVAGTSDDGTSVDLSPDAGDGVSVRLAAPKSAVKFAASALAVPPRRAARRLRSSDSGRSVGTRLRRSGMAWNYVPERPLIWYFAAHNTDAKVDRDRRRPDGRAGILLLSGR